MSRVDLGQADLRQDVLSKITRRWGTGSGMIAYLTTEKPVVEEAMSRARADLREADLRGAHLYGLNLRLTDLSGADLRDVVGVTDEELKRQAISLEGSTMPNGQKYEDWLKSKGSGEDRETE